MKAAALSAIVMMAAQAAAAAGIEFPPPPAGAQLYPQSPSSAPPVYRGGQYDPNVYAPKRDGSSYDTSSSPPAATPHNWDGFDGSAK